MPRPKIIPDPLYQLLRDGNITEFNKRKAAGETCDMRGCDFRSLDLRNMDVSGLDLSDGYFRQADLRGIDFRNTRLEGASLTNAHISGAYFPKELRAEEIMMSINCGTRLRYHS